VPQALQAQGLIIPSGSYVRLNGGNLGIGANFENNGSFTHSGGTVVFNGTTQSLGGSTATAFRDILINTGSTTTVATSGHTISRTILSNGTLDANGNLTLLSDATQTALVDGAGTGNVTGNLNIQRYIPVAFGYKYLSSPFQAATVNELSDELNLAANFPPLYTYTENVASNGWAYYNNPASLLNPLQGYAANFGTGNTAVTVDMTGVVNNGAQSTGTIYNNNQVYTQGFHLVGNPYPSPIDWDAATGWTRTNIDDAVYYFDAGTTDEYGGTYSSYINGISSDGVANGIIPAMQGFFIHVSDGSYPVSGELAMTNAVRVNNLMPNFHRKTMPEVPLLRLSLSFTTWAHKTDAAVIYFDEQAGGGYEQGRDALKILNTDKQVPSLYMLDGMEQLSISAMRSPDDSLYVVPLGVKADATDYVRIKAATIANMPEDLKIYLADAYTGTLHNLRQNVAYTALLKEKEDNTRFSVVFSKSELPSGSLIMSKQLNVHSRDGKLYVYLNIPTGGAGELAIHNTAGQQMAKYTLSGYGYHEVEAPFASGVYIVSFYSARGKFTNKLMLDTH
jgi:hypothetical protein